MFEPLEQYELITATTNNKKDFKGTVNHNIQNSEAV